MAQLAEAGKSAVFAVAIAFFMSFKFNIHISCLLQAIILPTSFYDNLTCRKYLFGTSGQVYGELLEDPTKSKKKFVKPPPLPEKKEEEDIKNID